MKNIEIRNKIEKNRIKYYEVAAVLGISPGTLSIWLREELELEKEEKVMKAIDELIKR